MGATCSRSRTANDRELVMEILKFGADVEVLAPEPLREKIKAALQSSIQPYL